jgi:hypothetical protein
LNGICYRNSGVGAEGIFLEIGLPLKGEKKKYFYEEKS